MCCFGLITLLDEQRILQNDYNLIVFTSVAVGVVNGESDLLVIFVAHFS